MRNKAKWIVIAVVLLTISGLVGNTLAAEIGNGKDKENTTISVADLLDSAIYDTEVTVYGTVSMLGEVFCPCFELTSGGETVTVWYDLMVEDDGTQVPAASIAGIENGDLVVVTGELKSTGGELPGGTFWAFNITKPGAVEPDMVQVPAPIDGIDIWIAESWPPQYFLHVMSGLPNGCAEFDSYNVVRKGDTIRVEVLNLEPADGDTACTEEYRTIEHTIPLGSDFESGKTYTVVVNGVTETFVSQ